MQPTEIEDAAAKIGNLSTAVNLRRPVPVTLHEIEENLLALLDSEALVAEDAEAEFKAELTEALKVAVDKRDRVAQFLANCSASIALADIEMDRLRKRKATFEKAVERLEAYAVETILSLGTDAKGKYRKLEGRTATLSVKRNPPSVDVQDEAAVPLAYKDASISAKCPADRWARAIQEIGVLFSVYCNPSVPISEDAQHVMALILDPKNVKHTIRKADVRKAIDAGAEVPGADVAMGEFHLEVK